MNREFESDEDTDSSSVLEPTTSRVRGRSITADAPAVAIPEQKKAESEAEHILRGILERIENLRRLRT